MNFGQDWGEVLSPTMGLLWSRQCLQPGGGGAARLRVTHPGVRM